jgi:hypothetical protein
MEQEPPNSPLKESGDQKIFISGHRQHTAMSHFRALENQAMLNSLSVSPNMVGGSSKAKSSRKWPTAAEEDPFVDGDKPQYKSVIPEDICSSR